MFQKIMLNLKTVSRWKSPHIRHLQKIEPFLLGWKSFWKNLLFVSTLWYSTYCSISLLPFCFSTIMTTRWEIEISSGIQIEKLPLSTSGRFHRIYSPDKILLRPWVTKTINLYFKIKLPVDLVQFDSLGTNYTNNTKMILSKKFQLFCSNNRIIQQDTSIVYHLYHAPF